MAKNGSGFVDTDPFVSMISVQDVGLDDLGIY